MTNPEDPIFPVLATTIRKARYGKTGNLVQLDEVQNKMLGLTKREYFAEKAMQGLVARGYSYDPAGEDWAESMARQALKLGNAMIKVLNEELK